MMNIKKERPAKHQATAATPAVGKVTAIAGTLNAATGSKSQSQKNKQAQKHTPKPAAASHSDDVNRQQKLQAILLADSFSKSFRPITSEGPKVLLPLVNVPMIEYTIEFLAQNGVEEVEASTATFIDHLHEFITLLELSSRSSSSVSGTRT